MTIDHENTVKLYSLTPSMLGRGHVILEPGGPVWVRCVFTYNHITSESYHRFQSIHASDCHPQLAVGVTDGSCLTTNSLRSTRRGGSVVCHTSPSSLFSCLRTQCSHFWCTRYINLITAGRRASTGCLSSSSHR